MNVRCLFDYCVSKQGAGKEVEQLRGKILLLEAQVVKKTDDEIYAQSLACSTHRALELKVAEASELLKENRELQASVESLNTQLEGVKQELAVSKTSWVASRLYIQSSKLSDYISCHVYLCLCTLRSFSLFLCLCCVVRFRCFFATYTRLENASARLAADDVWVPCVRLLVFRSHDRG